jgi:pyruvate carboxylase
LLVFVFSGPSRRSVPDLQLEQMLPLNDYWAVVRQHYAAFEQVTTEVFSKAEVSFF